MNPSEHNHEHSNERARDARGAADRSRARWVFLAFAAVAAFFLVTEHRAHLFGVLPFLLLLACPFLHWFMHGGHGGHGGKPDEHGRRDEK